MEKLTVRELKEKEKFKNAGVADIIILAKKINEIIESYKPCKHESAYQVEGFNDIYYNVCNDCGVLFLASKVD